MSGIWLRCPNCDLEIKVEMWLTRNGTDVSFEPDMTLVAEHARNCVEENG